ncbi:hypothetical protein MAR_023150 [Mya arenaria]|uniref:Uncharacterized protein n=1 Tax=Mya arenaria TaxID=6604 RepID=A0ABY7DPY4_MYAAR|nr:hypothetical protein MAR_023150 [Mya arenaria]
MGFLSHGEFGHTDDNQVAEENTIKIWVGRDNDGTAESLHVSMEFYDSSVRDPMETTQSTLEKTGNT